MPIKPVILCGGSGTRLWPESRENLPKQFIPIFGRKNLFDLTLERLNHIGKIISPIIATNINYKFMVKKLLNQSNLNGFLLLEPFKRNTAAIIYLAAKFSNKEDILLIMPSDHYIPDTEYFGKTILQLSNVISNSHWITFGINPTFPSTAYGYINIHNKVDIKNKLSRVKGFIEKPTKNQAIKLINNGKNLWNAGIFMGQASFIIDSYKTHAPEIVKACDIAFEKSNIDFKTREINFDLDSFKTIPSNSIDYAIMEKDSNILAYPYKREWNDIGSWDSIASIDNKKINKENIFELETSNNYIRNDKRLIATIGTKDLIVIDTDNSTLILQKGQSEKVKDVVNHLSLNKTFNWNEHTFDYRPWGKFEILLDDKHCKIKRLTIDPKQRLSLQYHNHRSEHWLIIFGEAYIYLDKHTNILKAGESIDIPLRSHHFVENQSDLPLIIIETQLGEYFGEDDIIRLYDPHNR
jgi:mannose-1-phosphate guanylyltransferase/mannose-6-phosphate isomerase